MAAMNAVLISEMRVSEYNGATTLTFAFPHFMPLLSFASASNHCKSASSETYVDI
jgi:hypothetical protein